MFPIVPDFPVTQNGLVSVCCAGPFFLPRRFLSKAALEKEHIYARQKEHAMENLATTLVTGQTLSVVKAAESSGTLDVTFGTGGKVTTDARFHQPPVILEYSSVPRD
jgi:hypothetical protein